MIIDFDTHIAAKKENVAVTAEELLQIMDKAGIDKAVAWPMVTYTRELTADNRAVWEASKKYPDRIIPFGAVNPRLGVEAAMNELDRCIDEYGFRGIKLNGGRDQYYIDDPVLSLPLVNKIAARKLILAFHCGHKDPVFSHPFIVGKIAKQFPQLSIVMVHMGGMQGLHDAAIQVCKECPNVYPAASESNPKAIVKAIKELGPERVLFASDVPFTLGYTDVAVFEAILKNFDSTARDLVMGGNAARILNI
jgi:uncharacterized protein